MLDLGFVLLLTWWSAGLGLRMMRWFGPSPDRAIDELALSVPLGLGALSLATLGLGELGRLSLAGLAVVVAIGAWLGGRDALRILTRLGRVCRNIRHQPPILSPQLPFDLALATTVLGTLLTALMPVTDGDALCYHLQVPKVFLARHAAVFDPDLHETVYPLVTEMLYAVALAARGPVACRLVQWVLGLAFAANVTALARPVLGPRARWAGTVALLVPAISNGMGAPLNDVALAAFGNAALFAWMRWHDRPSLQSAALAGAFAGLALGVKYPALVWVGLLGLTMMVLVGCVKRTNSRAGMKAGAFHAPYGMGHLATFGAMALLIGGCWYLRAYHYTGNPVYPFFRQTFGGAGLDEVLDPHKRPMPVTLGNVLTALGPMTLQPDRFESFSHQLGPAFLLFLPGLFLVRTTRRVWALAALGFAFLTLCVSQRQSMRFVLTAVGPMSVAVAWLASTWQERRTVPGRILFAMVVVVLGFEASLALARTRHGLGVVFGRESSESFLSRREPTYRVARWVAGHLPSTARLVGQEHRGFYFSCDYTMELAHRRSTGLGTHGESADEIVAHFREAGFSHLLLCPPVPESAVEFDPTLNRRLAPWLAGREPLYRARIADPDGVVRRYVLYDLAPGAELARGVEGVRR